LGLRILLSEGLQLQAAGEAKVTSDGLRYEGWRVVAAGGVGIFFSTLYVLSFAVLLKPLTEEFSWSREAVSRAYASMTLAVAISAPVIGHLVDRTGPRPVVGPFLVIAACAFASLSALTPHLWHLYLVFLVIGLVVPANSPVVYSRVVSSWFDRRRGAALATVIASAALGGVVHPPLVQRLVRAFGWRGMCLTLGCTVIAIGFPIVLKFVREPPRAVGAISSGDGTSTSEALRSRVFWTLVIVVFGGSLPISGMVVHLGALLTDRGESPERAALALSVMGAASLLGRLSTGWLMDRFIATRVSVVLLTLASAGLLLLLGSPSFATALVAATLVGFGTGGEVDVTPYLLSRYFGLRSFGMLYGLNWTAFGLSSAIGPVLMGRAFDATRSYDGVIFAIAIGVVISAALMLTLPPYRRP
jgi:MFS family permease